MDPKSGTTWTQANNPVVNGGFVPSTDDRASITDETGSVGAIHNCTNSKKKVKWYTPEVSFVLKNFAAPFGSCKTVLNSHSMPDKVRFMMENSPHVSTPDGAAVALARVPSMSKEMMSGLNSLYELKDCQAFLKLIPVHLLWAVARRKRAESVTAFNEWVSEIGQTVKSPIGLLQAVAGADLMWKFGVKPLLKDINQVHNTLSTINDKTRELLSKKFSVCGRYEEKRSDGADWFNFLNGSTFAFYRERAFYTRTTARTWVYGAVKHIDPSKLPSFDVARSRSLLEQLGLSLDATDVWEAVPYSFVWDWFLPIQRFLEQFSRLQVDPSWLLTDGWWSSVKSSTQGTAQWEVTPYTGSNCTLSQFGVNQHQAVFECTSYQRTRLTTPPVGFPNIYIPALQLPSFEQGFTGFELLLQRIKRTLK